MNERSYYTVIIERRQVNSVMHIIMDESYKRSVVFSFSGRTVVVVVVANSNRSSWCPYLFQMLLICIYSESREKSSIEMWKFKRCLKLFYRRSRGFKKWIRKV